MDTRVYVMTHKEFTKPEDDMYISLHVGRAISKDLGYIGDNTGDNISTKNKNYCELTGLYWIWKNVSCDIVGICHYRRYFTHNEDFIRKGTIEELLKQYDVIIPTSGITGEGTVAEHYKLKHNICDLDMCRMIISEQCPEYLDAFDVSYNGIFMCVGNMMITRKKVFDDYCVWLFAILFELEKRIDISDYDEYQSRIWGFLSERLLRVWLLKNSYKVYEEKMQMIDPQDAYNQLVAVGIKRKMLRLVLKDLIEKYKREDYYDIVDNSPLEVDFHNKIPVFACWWQGYDEAPELVKACLNSVDSNLPDDITEMHLITLENVGMYINLPQWIIDKYTKGAITMAQLSDILRVGLLYRYGGMWIDATYFCAKPFDRNIFLNDSLFTQKLDKAMWKSDVSQGRWAGNFIKGRAGHKLFRFMLNAFYEYWQSQDELIDYYLIDYLIDIAYEEFEDVRREIDECEKSEPKVFELLPLLNRKFSEEKWNELKKDTSLFKLLYRNTIEYRFENIIGEPTFYNCLISGKL